MTKDDIIALTKSRIPGVSDGTTGPSSNQVFSVVGPTGPTGPPGPTGAGSNVIISDTPPVSSDSGSLWFNTIDAKLYLNLDGIFIGLT